ncbi:MAG: Trk system potassium transporter TrkA [Clostridia bacterium]|nr:Trk system potassium transporter TrkA [Clostridia bacterium]
MKIIVIGDGNVGDTLIRYISGEGHSVTVIDTSVVRINRVVNQYDVQGVVGNGASHDIQQEAGVKDADLLIAVAGSDELNMVCCMLAKKLGARRAIARVRNPEYFREMGFLRDYLEIDLVVNPEFEAAREITRLIRFPAALKLDAFAKGRVDMAEIYISAGHPLADKKLASLTSSFGVSVLVCAVRRGGEVVIPGGDFVIREGDSISITASHKDLSAFFGRLGLLGKPIRSVMIMGGGRSSFYLATNLLSLGIRTHIVERDEARARELAERLPQASIICGDCTDGELLEEEGIDEMDACVMLTSNDEINVLISMFARTHGIEKIISRVDSEGFVKMLPAGLGADSIISPRDISAETVLRYLRGLDNSKKTARGEGASEHSAIQTLYKLCDGAAEALEFNVDKSFRALGIPFMSPEFKMKKNTLIASIVRRNTVIYPHGSSTLEEGDSVIIVTTNPQLSDLNDILA